MMAKRKVALIVLDGWGMAPPGPGNAVALAEPSFFSSLWRSSPKQLLEASGEAVGLLPGTIGNSEVGHLHLGAGRTVEQDVTRITHAIRTGSFYRNPRLLKAVRGAAKHGRLHLMGLVSDGAVHSHIDHALALIAMAQRAGVPQVYIHAFTDGRDTRPTAGARYISRLESALGRADARWRVATVCGRYFAMDRDKRWDRTRKAFNLLVDGKGKRHRSAQEAVRAAYAEGQTDEFITPRVIDPQGTMREGDTVIFFNFRADRARQIVRALNERAFRGFARRRPRLRFVCMANYDDSFRFPVIFPPERIGETLGEVIAKAGLRQSRMAETEKWAHVTFFFNGLTDRRFRNERRILIPSPRVATYDLKPEMSAFALAAAAVREIRSVAPEFLLLNFANTDMVGHSGSIPATIAAVRAVDACLAAVVRDALARGYAVLVTADHGNAERKLHRDGTVCTAHSTNVVPLILVGAEGTRLRLSKRATLANIAPTILELLGVKKPRAMSGSSLLLQS